MSRLKKIPNVLTFTVLICILTTMITLTGCSHEVQVEDILNNLGEYDGQNVTILEGSTSGAFWLPELGKGGYQIMGKTGVKIWVVTPSMPPQQFEVVKLKGTVSKNITLGDRVLEPVIIEQNRRLIYQYPLPSSTSTNTTNSSTLMSIPPVPISAWADCPALAVYLDFPHISDYRTAPTALVPITGYVNKLQAKVTVNEVEVQVDRNGAFSTEVQFKEGNNVIKAVATLGDQTDTMSYTLIVDTEGVIIPPGQGIANQSRLLFDNLIEMKAGETKIMDVTLEVRKDIRQPEEFTYTVSHVTTEYSESTIPMPKGLDVGIEPSQFLGCPNTTYHSMLTIKTTETLMPGEYWLIFQQKTGRGGGTTGWIKVSVQSKQIGLSL